MNFLRAAKYPSTFFAKYAMIVTTKIVMTLEQKKNVTNVQNRLLKTSKITLFSRMWTSFLWY